MRCARCGNDNPDDNRFCGMCGATLLASPVTPVAETQTQRAASSAAVIPSPVAPVITAPPPPPPPPPARVERPAPPEPEMDEPVISGPSFLGLNNPAPRKRATLSIDSHDSHRSRGGHYLLEDEEEPRRGGGGKFLLILVALALALGFGYLRWKNHGFDWLSPSANKPPAATQAPDAADNGSTPSSTNSTTAPVPVQSAPAPAQPSPVQPTPTPAQPATDSAAGQNSPANPASSTPPATAPTADNDSAAAQPKASAKPDENSTADKDPGDEDATPAPGPKKSVKPNAAVSKPKPSAPPAPAVDSVAEARKYLYGKGAAQDCDRGLRLLKPAANQSNSNAMIEMGALYSAGLCTPRDLPTAYRWFALALRKEPENSSVQKDLQKLWGEMTQPERQLAIKLTQ